MTTTPFGSRRVVFSFAAALLCGLVVFVLPRAVFNTVAPLVAQQPAAAPAVQAPASSGASAPAPVSTLATQNSLPPIPFGTRLIGLIGMAMILGIGWAMSKD